MSSFWGEVVFVVVGEFADEDGGDELFESKWDEESEPEGEWENEPLESLK